MNGFQIAIMLIHFGCAKGDAMATGAAIAQASSITHINPLALSAIAIHESGGTCRNVVKADGKPGSCSVGPFQIYCVGCEKVCVRRYLDRRRAAARAAAIILYGMRICSRGRSVIHRPWYCGISPLGRYNPGSRAWLYRVLMKWRDMEVIWRRTKEARR